LAAAITGNVDWLLSLDKHFIKADLMELKGKKDIPQICSPGEFLEKILR